MLEATKDGWKCLDCTYTQNWAHDWSANWGWASTAEFAEFRSKVRGALFPFWPNNPGVSDQEVIEAIEKAVAIAVKAEVNGN